MLVKQTSLRTIGIEPNDNISFPIGTALAVKKYYDFLNLYEVFGKFKRRGIDINSLIQALLSYKLTQNQSVHQGSAWINRPDVLKIFELESFEERTLYRVLETIGDNHEEIMLDIRDILFKTYDFEHTNVNMDWTSFVLYGEKCPIGKYGYSRDHRPDKKQITVGLTELANPINVPIGLTINPGNINDQVHFTDTFGQVKDKLNPGSLIVFDQGANRKKNLDKISRSKMKYLTMKALNKSDEETRIRRFDPKKAELVDWKDKVYGIKYRKPKKFNYFYFSEKLESDMIEARLRKVDRLFKEAEQLQECIDKHRGLPKRYRINNPLVQCEYSYQTKLKNMSPEDAKEILKNVAITHREGFFCLVSNEDLTLEEALHIYRQKDSIEKIFNSLKNEIDIRPIRVWSVRSVNGALLIGFLAQLIISLIRYEHAELKHTSPKFIKFSLMNLTATIEYGQFGKKRFILSNFDPISKMILGQNQADA
jgi:transposase